MTELLSRSSPFCIGGLRLGFKKITLFEQISGVTEVHSRSTPFCLGGLPRFKKSGVTEILSRNTPFCSGGLVERIPGVTEVLSRSTPLCVDGLRLRSKIITLVELILRAAKVLSRSTLLKK